MYRSRLNLATLRRMYSSPNHAERKGNTVSLREMLGLAGAAVAGTSPVLKALETAVGEPLKLVGDCTPYTRPCRHRR